MDLQTLSTPAGVLTFNSDSGGLALWVDPGQSTGLGTGEVRAAIDDQSGQSGFILHPEWYETGSSFVIVGVIDAESVAIRDAAMLSMKQKLRSILSATGTLSFGSAGSVTVRWNLGLDFPHLSGILKGFRFGIVSADPW